MGIKSDYNIGESMIDIIYDIQGRKRGSMAQVYDIGKKGGERERVRGRKEGERKGKEGGRG